MEDAKLPVVNGNGTKGLGALLSSGDNWTKAIIIGGLILNTYLTRNNGSGIDTNTEKIAALKVQTAREVRFIYDQQKHYIEYINLARVQHDSIMDKLGIAHPKMTPIPIPTPPPQIEMEPHP